MLKEISDLTQTSGDLNRRWFADTGMDLYLWYDNNADIVRFQISYDKDNDEQVVTWHLNEGISHHGVDRDNSNPGMMKASPLLNECTRAGLERAKDCFVKSGQKLEHDLYEFILTRLQQYP